MEYTRQLRGSKAKAKQTSQLHIQVIIIILELYYVPPTPQTMEGPGVEERDGTQRK